MWLLAALEVTEVTVEVTSERVMSEPGKWGVVILLQYVKAVLRGVLVFYMRSGLLTSPPVPSPDRKQAKVTAVSCIISHFCTNIPITRTIQCSSLRHWKVGFSQ